MRIPQHKNPTTTERRATAPYNFVSLPDVVVPAQSLPARDRYHADRHTGVFHCTLTTETPLYTRSALDEDEYGRIQSKDKSDFFYVDPATRKPVIPGSSLRGVLRSLVEIVSFSKLQPVTDRWLFFRTMDGSRVMTAYGERVGLTPQDNRIRGGIFQTDGENHSIQPCLVSRVPYDTGSDYKIFGQNVWTGNRPNLIPNWQLHNQPMWVKLARGATKNLFHFRFAEGVERGEPNKTGYYPATLVITGWAPERKIRDRGRVVGIDKKKGEFAFVKTREAPVSVDAKFVRDFETEGQISKWQEDAFPLDQPEDAGRKMKGGLRNGEPVFYMQEEDGSVAFGRAAKFRLPYKHSPRAMLPNYGTEYDKAQPDLIDMTEAIFGRVDEVADVEHQIAGRVYVGDAHVAENTPFSWAVDDARRPKVLSSPKPTTVQHYLTQDESDAVKKLRHYDDAPEDTTLRGQKLYWHKQETLSVDDWAESGNHPGSSLHTGPIRPVGEGVEFKFDLRFENLTDEELGAVMWVMKAAGHDRYRIKLGLGKPYGLGTVKVTHELEIADPIGRYLRLGDMSGWLNSRQEVDTDNLLQAFERRVLCYLGKNRRKGARCLSQVNRIQELLAMLTWEGPSPESTQYMALADFRDRKVLPSPTTLIGGNILPIVEPMTFEEIRASLPWRVATVTKSPARGKGILIDEETEETFFFKQEDVITQGYTPGARHRIMYAVGEDIDCSRIVFVRKRS